MRCGVFPILFLAAACFFASCDEKAPPTPEQIAAWVKQLGDDDLDTRNKAEAGLSESGDAAAAALEKVKESPDLEVRTRGMRLLGALKTAPLLRKMAEVSSNAQSIEADMQMSIHVRVGDRTVEQEMRGHIRSLRDGKHFVVNMTLKAMFEITTKMVADGTHQWMEIGMDNAPAVGGGKNPIRVQKYSLSELQKKNGGKPVQPLEQTEEIRKMFAFTELREERVQGEECYVLEGGLKPEIQKKTEQIQPFTNAKRARLSIAKETMLMRKSEMLDEGNNVIMSTELLNVKLGVEFDPKIFTYTPPESAEITDMDAAKDAEK